MSTRRASKEVGTRASLLAFGHLLRRLRLAADLTQEELAERAMVSVRSISDLERGSTHRPRRDTVQLLAEGLRLKGPEHVAFIALARGRSLAAALDRSYESAVRGVVPRPPTPIVGRAREAAEATALLLDPDVRLLTLIGPGGVGKTRLALEVAAEIGDALRDGVVFVDLVPLRDPELVVSAIAQAVGAIAAPEQPLRQSVVAALQDKQLLLLLDNFEHLATAAVVVAELLAECPGLTVLATSRVPLHIRPEHEYLVEPLALPDRGAVVSFIDLRTFPAVELFVRRAEAANRGFALTAENAQAMAEIATRLDGLPLALELAAPRLKILSPATLLARLDRRFPLLTGGAHDLPVRQQALRATLDWSHDLLSAEEQRLFRRLAVFAGDCTLEAVAEVGGRKADDGSQDEGPTSDLFDVLTGLVDKSLLVARDDGGDEPRFGMLETIREYGLERLVAAGEETAVRERHQAWCVDLAARAEPELLGADQQRWFARLEREHDNLRVALGWAVGRGDAEPALRLAGTLYRFWATRGHYEEGRRWLEQALALDTQSVSSWRGNALLGLGVMVFFQGDYDWAEALWEESLTLFSTLEDVTGVAYSYGNLGLIADAQEDYDRATASYEEALARFRQLNDEKYISFMLHNIGLIAYFQGKYERATELIEESLALVRAQADQNSISLASGNLGMVAFAQGNYGRALALQRESLAEWQQVSNKPWLARSVEHFALIAAATGDAERAACLFGAGSALRAAFKSSQPPNDRQINERFICLASERLGAERFAAAWAEGETMSLEEAIAHALDDGRP